MRSFIKKFHIKLSKKKREQLKANSKKAKVVVRKRKPHGSFTVSCPQLFHPSFKHIQNLCRTFPVGWNSSNNTFGFTMFFFHMVARDRNRFRVKESRWLTLLVPSRLRSGGPGLKKHKSIRLCMGRGCASSTKPIRTGTGCSIVVVGAFLGPVQFHFVGFQRIALQRCHQDRFR